MVGHLVLVQAVGVRIPVPEQVLTTSKKQTSVQEPVFFVYKKASLLTGPGRVL